MPNSTQQRTALVVLYGGNNFFNVLGVIKSRQVDRLLEDWIRYVDTPISLRNIVTNSRLTIALSYLSGVFMRSKLGEGEYYTCDCQISNKGFALVPRDKYQLWKNENGSSAYIDDFIIAKYTTISLPELEILQCLHTTSGIQLTGICEKTGRNVSEVQLSIAGLMQRGFLKGNDQSGYHTNSQLLNESIIVGQVVEYSINK